jgi:hypothetical protein
VISRRFAGVDGQGTRTVLNRQTSFGTFGGGDANICMPCVNICGTSGGNTTPGGNGGSGTPRAGPPPRGQHRPRCDPPCTERCGCEEREQRDGRGPGENHLCHKATLTPTIG